MGRSIPENPGEFYRPVHEWVTKYKANHNSTSKIELGFEYINTSSTKWIYTIIKELSEMRGIVSNAKITWYYEEGDEDMCELGYILKSLISCPFILVEVDDMSKDRYDRILSESL